MCVGSEFQVDGAETENARKVTSDAGRSGQKICVGRTSTCTPGLRCGILIFKRLILRCVCVFRLVCRSFASFTVCCLYLFYNEMM